MSLRSIATRGRAMRWYGKIQSAKNPEAAAIWRSRDVEPEECQPFGMTSDYITDEAHLLCVEDGAALWSLLDCVCTPREAKLIRLRFLHELTLDEVGAAFGISRERVRQIEGKALRKLRSHVLKNDSLNIPPRWIPVRSPVYAWTRPL